MSGVKCYCCGDVYHHDDEITFLLGDTIVYVDEQYPDWDKAICFECAEFFFVVETGTGMLFHASLQDFGKYHITGSSADCYYKFDEVRQFVDSGAWRLL